MSGPFLTRLARARPDPGGGAAAAYVAEVALALLTKVIRVEEARPRQDETRKALWADQLKDAKARRQRLARLRQADVEAYLAMAQALSSGAEPLARKYRLVEVATRCPWRIMEEAIQALEAVAKTGELCRPHLLPDLLVVVETLAGAWQGAHHIAAANLPYLPEGRRKKWAARLTETFRQGMAATLEVRSRLLARTQDPWRSP